MSAGIKDYSDRRTATLIIFVFGAMLVALITGAWSWLSTPPDPTQAWLAQMQRDCIAQRSNGTYDSVTQVYSCYRTPLMRRPSLVFERKLGERNGD